MAAFCTAGAVEGDTITYLSKSQLEWTDFRMNPKLSDSSKLTLNLTIVTITKDVGFWFGTITVESVAGIRRDSSYVKPEFMTDQLLKYAQIKYDIAHFYAKECEKEINERKINAGATKKIGKIIQSYIDKMNTQLENFKIETADGDNSEAIDLWRAKLTNGNL